MADEMDLPVLPPDDHCQRLPLPSITPFRKRSRGYSSGYSSDVPMFSSDDFADASLENYESPRLKKQHRRLWWDDGRSWPKQAKKQARNLDSGVFMASDSSNPDDGFVMESPMMPGFQRLENKFAETTLLSLPLPLQGEALAQKIVMDCLEDCREIVDLS